MILSCDNSNSKYGGHIHLYETTKMVCVRKVCSDLKSVQNGHILDIRKSRYQMGWIVHLVILKIQGHVTPVR